MVQHPVSKRSGGYFSLFGLMNEKICVTARAIYFISQFIAQFDQILLKIIFIAGYAGMTVPSA